MTMLGVISPFTSRLGIGASVPLGASAIVHTQGRNDMATSQILMFHWVVRGPDGIIALEDTDKTLFGVPPGGTEDRMTPRFDLDKPGNWTVAIELLMNPDSPVVVDRYEGLLCVVTEEEEYAGTIIIPMEIDYGSTTMLGTIKAIPAIDVPLDQYAKVYTRGRNDSSVSRIMMFHWVVRDPDGLVILDDTDDTLFGVPPEGTEDRMTPRFDLTKEGTYTVKAELLMNPDNPVIVDSYDDPLCTVVEEIPPPPEYELIQHTIYHFAYIYDGDVEVSTATFKTDPFTPSAWLGEKFASKLEEEVRARGGRPIEVKVYVDKTPFLWTNFRIEVSSTPIGGVTEVAPGRIGVGIAPWLAIILVCLAITAVIVVATLAFEMVMDRIQHKPGLHEVKPAWGKEALILDIQDAEEYWERPPTPVETLQEMSEEELRDHLDQIAEEEVPPEASPWAIVALVVGLGVVGVGAAVALAAGRK